MKKSFVMIGVGIIMLGLIGGAVYYYMHYMRKSEHAHIAEQINELATIFKRINESSHILGFEKEKNDIAFLNIKKDGFTGSQVGLMKLGDPKQWEGPYLEENPTVEGKYYQIVKAKEGYFILPGDGVMLPSGKIIGKDIMINKDTDMMSLIHDEKELSYRGKPLAAMVPMTEMPVPDIPDF